MAASPFSCRQKQSFLELWSHNCSFEGDYNDKAVYRITLFIILINIVTSYLNNCLLKYLKYFSDIIQYMDTWCIHSDIKDEVLILISQIEYFHDSNITPEVFLWFRYHTLSLLWSWCHTWSAPWIQVSHLKCSFDSDVTPEVLLWFWCHTWCASWIMTSYMKYFFASDIIHKVL